jgi:hypothetical protein
MSDYYITLDFSTGDKKVINPTWVQEVPSGTINGTNTNFTLSYTPRDSNSLLVFKNGLVVPNSEYSLSNNTITFNTAPSINDTLYAYYLK